LANLATLVAKASLNLKMDEFIFLQYLSDDDQVCQAENKLFRESFPRNP